MILISTVEEKPYPIYSEDGQGPESALGSVKGWVFTLLGLIDALAIVDLHEQCETADFFNPNGLSPVNRRATSYHLGLPQFSVHSDVPGRG